MMDAGKLKPVLLALALGVTPGHSQGGVRDQPQPETATATIRGRVMAGSDIGVRKARVTLTTDTGTPIDLVYTDSEGRFEFSGVAPGRYTIAAWKSGWVETRFGARSFFDRSVSLVVGAGDVLEDVQLVLARGAAISGRVLDEDGEPLVNMSVAVGRVITQNGRLQFVRAGETDTDDRGEYRIGGLPAGSFVVSVFGFSSTRGGGSSGFDPLQGPHTVFYPQTLSLTLATPIVLQSGDDLSGIDVTFASAGPTPRVSGRVFDATSRSTFLSLDIFGDGNGIPAAMSGMSMGLPMTGDFSIPLVPGNYIFMAQSDTGTATQQISVEREDISGVQLALVKPARVSGRVLSNGAVSHPYGRVTVEAWALESLTGMVAARPQSILRVPVTADGRFTFASVIGRRVLRVNGLQPSWIVQSITTGGRDVLDIPIDFKGGEDLRDVVITITDRSAEIDGGVFDGSGASVSAVSLLLFAEDRRQLPQRAWWEKSDLLGRFRIAGLPPGNYLMALVADVDDTRWSTAEYLDTLRAQATRLTIASAEKKSMWLEWSEPR